MPAQLEAISRPGENRETNWVNRLFNRDGYTPEYQELKFTLHRKLLDRINLEALSSMAGERVRAEIRAAVAKLVEEEKTPLSLVEKDRVIEEILDEVFGLGPLEPLLQDPTVSDILVTTPRLVYVERGGKLYRTPVEFKDDAHLLRIIEKIVSRVGRRVDESSPLVDARLPDGSRVNAVIPPVAVDGPLLSIRRFGRTALKGEDLVAKLSMTEGMLELLKACVKARLNILICGGTGSGKTTLLNALSVVHPRGRAHRHHRRRGGAAAPAAPRGAHGDAPGQCGRRGRDPHPATGDQRPAYAAGPHHRGRGARRGSAGHAAGHEHGPRRFADHDPRQHPARRPGPPGGDGRHGEREHGHALHPPADRLRRSTCSCRWRGSATARAASPTSRKWSGWSRT